MAKLDTVIQMLKKERDRLTSELKGITAALAAFGAAYRGGASRRHLSAAGRARIAAAQRARWAKARANQNKTKGSIQNNVVTMSKKRTLSSAARKKIVAAQRARWAAAKKAAS